MDLTDAQWGATASVRTQLIEGARRNDNAEDRN